MKNDGEAPDERARRTRVGQEPRRSQRPQRRQRILQAFPDRFGPGVGNVVIRIGVRYVGIEAAQVSRGERPDQIACVFGDGDRFRNIVRHFPGSVMHNPGVVVVQMDPRLVVVGSVALGLGTLDRRAAFHRTFIGMIRHIDPAEAVRADVLLQPVIRAEAALQHIPELFKALLPGNLERDHRLRRHKLSAFLLLQHHGRSAVAAEGSCRRIHRADFRAAGRTGQHVHGEAASGLPGLPLVRLLNTHGPVAAAALQLLLFCAYVQNGAIWDFYLKNGCCKLIF